jgi:hypothetical protein
MIVREYPVATLGRYGAARAQVVGCMHPPRLFNAIAAVINQVVALWTYQRHNIQNGQVYMDNPLP